MYNVIDLSNYIIAAFEKRKAPITNLKLQKVLYYIQGYFYSEFGRAAFCDELCAWTYGPVVPLAYYEYHLFGSAPLSVNKEVKLFANREERRIIDKIIDKCKGIPSSRLVSMTHDETPWKSVSVGETIPNQVIEKFFLTNDPLGLRA